MTIRILTEDGFVLSTEAGGHVVLDGSLGLASGAVSQLPVSAMSPRFTAAVANPFRLLLDNPDAQFIYLLVAQPYDPLLPRSYTGDPVSSGPVCGSPIGRTVYGGIRTLYLSDKGFKTSPSETPANQDFPGRLSSPYSFQLDAWSGDEPGSRATQGGFGEVTIRNEDGGLDAWLAYGWDGVPIEIKVGAPGFTYDEFAIVLNGVVAKLPQHDAKSIVISIQDRQLIFQRPVQPNLYAGTGGLNGGSDLAGKPKPLGYGQIVAAEPVLIDAGNLVYQLHDGTIQSVDRVTDMAVGLVSDGDRSDVYSWTPVSGHYITDLAHGLVRLGSKPAGKVAVAFHGEAGPLGYVSSPTGILRRIATTRLVDGDLVDPDDIDSAAFATAESAFGYAVGLYVKDPTDAATLFDELMATAGGWWCFTRAGLLTVGILALPDGPVVEFTPADFLEQGFQLDSVALPAWRRRLGYQRVWNVHGQADLAGSVSDADRTFFASEYRFVEGSDDTVRTVHSLARDVEQPSLIADAGAAATVVAARAALFGEERRVYSFAVKRALFRYFVGQPVAVRRPRFGLDDGVAGVIKGIAEDVRSDRTVLKVWMGAPRIVTPAPIVDSGAGPWSDEFSEEFG